MPHEITESAMLMAFARAASKAQKIEALLQDTVLGVEIVRDTRNRSFREISKEIDKLPLGPLKQKYVEVIGTKVDDRCDR